jgi:Tol biopolymer transport system component
MGSYIAEVGQKNPARTPLAVPDREWITNTAWSPDGRLLSFAARLPQMPAGSPVRLMVRDLASGGDRVVLQWIGSISRGSSWTADGRSLIVSRVIGTGPFQIDRVDVASGAVQPLVPAITTPVTLLASPPTAGRCISLPPNPA